MLNIFLGLVYLAIGLMLIYLALSLYDFGVTIYYIMKRRF